MARDPQVTGLTADSRKVGPGMLFAALPGTKADGRAFIPQAVAAGAVAVLAPPGTLVPEGTALVEDENPRRAFALMAARFFGAQPGIMAAVTGTNGKTSVASFTRQIWSRLGHPAASLGTLGVQAPGIDLGGGLTTPDTAALHEMLAELAGKGVTHAVMEASSHGLDQFRLDGIRLAAGAFTNLTRDHLDYHGSMEAYGEAKLRLFTEVLPPGAGAVVNADSDFWPTIRVACAAHRLRVLTFGSAPECDIRLLRQIPEPDGQSLELELFGRRRDLRLPLAGGFQAANALCALGLVVACGGDAEQAAEALEHLEGVRGRLQRVAARKNGAAIYVDYAHTPDALETVLRALRPHAANRLWVVFGCGGDRDPGKRPQMGAIAQALADRVIVTDDNPRSEAASGIRAAIMAACPGATEIGDRARAIREAVAGLEAGDLLVVAGKGHERGQIVGSEVLPFDDAEEACKAVTEIDGGTA